VLLEPLRGCHQIRSFMQRGGRREARHHRRHPEPTDIDTREAGTHGCRIDMMQARHRFA
jgi:hypothetical protein